MPTVPSSSWVIVTLRLPLAPKRASWREPSSTTTRPALVVPAALKSVRLGEPPGAVARRARGALRVRELDERGAVGSDAENETAPHGNVGEAQAEGAVLDAQERARRAVAVAQHEALDLGRHGGARQRGL